MSFISYVSGDLFSAPAGSILVHACNAKGSWGAGIALAFKQRFPDAFKVYRAHCQENGDSLAGTCLIIDGGSHYIACLFTSRAYGRNKDSPEQILTATDSALRDLMAQNTDANLELHACRFNSGNFGVPWESTEAIIERLGIPMTVYTPVE